jgi:glycosyltransferase involved in cell wall biosynthesis
MTPHPTKLVLAAYTHFGGRGLKGTGMYYLVREAWRRAYVQQVIAVSKRRCQYEFDLQLVDTLPGESRLVSGLAKIKKTLWSGFPSRFLGELIFDHYAAAKLAKFAGLLVTTPRLIQTTRAAKALGCKIILYGGAPHPQYFLQQIHRERDAFSQKSMRDQRSHAWGMARFAAHLRIVDYIIAVSNFTKETYIKCGFPEDRIFVAPLGVDMSKFQPTPLSLDDCFTYLFVAHADGATGIIKGLIYLLQAWSELDLKNAQLVVCGNIGQEVQEQIRPYREKLSKVQFTGFVRNVADYYRQAAVFVYPTLADGLPKVVLEAMASGRPIITTPILKPVVREGLDGFYIPTRDVEALKERMLYCYTHREEVARLGANASEQAQRFTWERFSRQAADIVEKVVATQ